jgi:hypothetical protein
MHIVSTQILSFIDPLDAHRLIQTSKTIQKAIYGYNLLAFYNKFSIILSHSWNSFPICCECGHYRKLMYVRGDMRKYNRCSTERCSCVEECRQVAFDISFHLDIPFVYFSSGETKCGVSYFKITEELGPGLNDKIFNLIRFKKASIESYLSRVGSHIGDVMVFCPKGFHHRLGDMMSSEMIRRGLQDDLRLSKNLFTRLSADGLYYSCAYLN